MGLLDLLRRKSNQDHNTLAGQFDQYLWHPGDKRRTVKGSGEMSTTHLGVRRTDGSQVLIKRYHPHSVENQAYRERIEREAEVTTALNATQRVDLFIHEGFIFLVRDYIEGISFKDLMRWRYRKGIGEANLLKLFMMALDALDRLHSHGYIHCDIRPENLLISRFNHQSPEEASVHLIDYGLVRRTGELHPEEGRKLPFALWYGAPEQLLNFPSLVGCHTDVYAMGVTFWHVLAREIPWGEGIAPMVMHLQLSRPLPEHKRVPEKIHSILLRATAKAELAKPPIYYSRDTLRSLVTDAIQHRYSTANEMKMALGQTRADL